MRPVLAERTRPWSHLVTAGWLATPAVVAAFSWLRYGDHGSAAVVASQVLFLTPLALACVTLAIAAIRARPQSRARLTWALFSAALVAVLVSETALAGATLSVATHASATTVFDVGNIIGMVLLFAGAGVAAGLDRANWRRTARVGLDAAALLVIVSAIVYRLWGADHLAATGDVAETLRLIAYSMLGVLLFQASVLVFGNSYTLRAPWNRVLAVGLGVLAVASVLWALTAFDTGVVIAAYVRGVSNALYLAAYCLFMMTGLVRLAHVGRVWASAPMFAVPGTWAGIGLSTVVLLSAVRIASLAAYEPAGSVSEAVYTIALALTALVTVARTALVTAEFTELSDRSLTDPVTGAMGPRALFNAWDAVTSEAERLGHTAIVYSADVDRFSQVNATLGFDGGDRVLHEVARAFERAAGPDSWVVRRAGDEFLIVATVRDEFAARRLGGRLVEAVRRVNHHGPLTASVGSAHRTADIDSAESVVRAAAVARIWAKRQGRDRYASYDDHVGEVMLLDERLADKRDARRDMARSLVAAYDARDPQSHDHARNVAALSRMLASEIGCSAEQVDRIEMAAVLHDIGKIALPNMMLGSRTLSVKERELAREHSQLGAKLLEFLADEGIPAWVRAHHERWDGAGYPDALAGVGIPLEARIIAIADAYDGMTAGRRFGAPMSKAAALQEIDLGMGTRFDPELAERFIGIVGANEVMGWSEEWIVP